MERRITSKKELDEVIGYWENCPRCSRYHVEDSLIKFLEIFTPHQIKGAMYIATSKGRPIILNTFVAFFTIGGVISKQANNPDISILERND